MEAAPEAFSAESLSGTMALDAHLRREIASLSEELAGLEFREVQIGGVSVHVVTREAVVTFNVPPLKDGSPWLWAQMFGTSWDPDKRAPGAWMVQFEDKHGRRATRFEGKNALEEASKLAVSVVEGLAASPPVFPKLKDKLVPPGDPGL